MKLIRNGSVVLHVNDEYVIIMSKDGKTSVWDPIGEYWGLAQGFKVVTDTYSNTFVLVPLGQPSRIRYSDFRPGDLD